MKKFIAVCVVLVAAVCGAVQIPLPEGITYSWTYDVVNLRNMDAKPVIEADGTFSWELISPVDVTASVSSPNPALRPPQHPAFIIPLRVANSELVAAGIVEGVDWATAYGAGQALVIQRAFVTKVATLLEMEEPTKSAWIETVLASLRGS